MTEIEAPKAQIHALTGIRIIPAFLVVIYHSGRGQFPFTVSPASEVLAGGGFLGEFLLFPFRLYSDSCLCRTVCRRNL